MSLKQTIQEDMKAAMKAGDKAKLAVIRLILAALKQIEVDERIELDDQRVQAILTKMIKQRRDSIEQYQQAKRQELADQEAFEIDIIQQYLPEPLSDDDVAKLIAAAISETGATSMKDMGKVMSILKTKLQGRADMGKVSGQIKAQLS